MLLPRRSLPVPLVAATRGLTLCDCVRSKVHGRGVRRSTHHVVAAESNRQKQNKDPLEVCWLVANLLVARQMSELGWRKVLMRTDLGDEPNQSWKL